MSTKIIKELEGTSNHSTDSWIDFIMCIIFVHFTGRWFTTGAHIENNSNHRTLAASNIHIVRCEKYKCAQDKVKHRKLWSVDISTLHWRSPDENWYLLNARKCCNSIESHYECWKCIQLLYINRTIRHFARRQYSLRDIINLLNQS